MVLKFKLNVLAILIVMSEPHLHAEAVSSVVDGIASGPRIIQNGNLA